MHQYMQSHFVTVHQFYCILHLCFKNYKQIRRIVVSRAATNLTLKKVKGQGQGYGMVPVERACHKDHACQISMVYLLYFRRYEPG